MTEARKRWSLTARPKQRTPPGEWIIWLILAGRGFGKTRTGAEDSKAFGLQHPNSRIAVIAPTFADARDTCIEGQSGLLSILPRRQVDKWNRSLGELVLTNGTIYRLFSAEEPDRLRGPQHHRAWGDEPAAWKHAKETFDMAMFGLRMGERPQLVLTGTPKPKPLIRELLTREGIDVHVTRGSTYENRDNLAPSFVGEIISRYEGTRLGRQEIEGEVLEDVEGALWTLHRIDELRVREAPQDLIKVYVGVDPAVTATEESDETGIVVVGQAWCTCKKDEEGEPKREKHLFVLADATAGRVAPSVWAAKAVNAYHDYSADRIIAETNNGGLMVKQTIETIEKVPVKLVHASRGKLTRAEPISALYEQGKVHHVGVFPQLEEQMCTYVPGDGDSPDRMDALVWACTDLYSVYDTGISRSPEADE